MTATPPLRIFEPRRHGWLAARLGLAMVAVAATESIGLMLIAPMLIALGEAGSGAGGASGFTHWLVGHGIPVRPGPLLAIYVFLAVLRAADHAGADLAGAHL